MYPEKYLAKKKQINQINKKKSSSVTICSDLHYQKLKQNQEETDRKNSLLQKRAPQLLLKN